jgi:hypothetical protein
MTQKLIEDLKNLTIANKDKYSYINLDRNNKYKGWVDDFNLKIIDSNTSLSLNLNNENDLFLLFVLASAWSRTGPWENAVFFTVYLKLYCNNILDWCNQKYVENEIKQKNISCEKIAKKVSGIACRKKYHLETIFIIV